MTSQSDLSPFPEKGSQQYRLLEALLAGKQVTHLGAIFDLNVMIVSARVAELRRMGWPVRKMETWHPNRDKFPNERVPIYFLDQHFRRWIGGDEGRGKHPALYPDSEGRGKFADWTMDDYRADQDAEE